MLIGQPCECCDDVSPCPDDLVAFFGCADPDSGLLWDLHTACPELGQDVPDRWVIALSYDEDENKLVPQHPNSGLLVVATDWECGCDWFGRHSGLGDVTEHLLKDNSPLVYRLRPTDGTLTIYHTGNLIATYANDEWSDLLCPVFLYRQSYDSSALASPPPKKICIRPLPTNAQTLCHRMCNGVFGTGYLIQTGDLTATTSVDCWLDNIFTGTCDLQIPAGSGCMNVPIDPHSSDGPCTLNASVTQIIISEPNGNLDCAVTCGYVPFPYRIVFEEIDGVPKLVWYGPQSQASVNQHYSILRKFQGENFFSPGLLWADPTGCTGDLVFTPIESQLVPADLLAELEADRVTPDSGACAGKSITCGSLCHDNLPSSIRLIQSGPDTELPDCTDCSGGTCRWMWTDFGVAESQWVYQSSSCSGQCMCPAAPTDPGDFIGQVVALPCTGLSA